MRSLVNAVSVISPKDILLKFRDKRLNGKNSIKV